MKWVSSVCQVERGKIKVGVRESETMRNNESMVSRFY